MKRFTLLFAAGWTVGCSWGQFTDLKKHTWVNESDRDSGKNAGDWGISVTAGPRADGIDGLDVGVGAGNPGGIANVLFDDSGAQDGMLAFDAIKNGSGVLSPLQSTSGPEGLAMTPDGTQLFVGAPQQASVFRYDIGADGVKNGTLITAQPGSGLPSPDNLGRLVFVGDLGIGTAGILDVAALGDTGIEIIEDLGNGASPVFRACTGGISGLTIGDPLGVGHTQIIYGTTTDVRAIDAADIVDTQACPAGTVIGSITLPSQSTQLSMAVGDLDGDGLADLAVGTGKEVDIFPQGGGAQVTVMPPADQTAVDFGGEVVIGDLDGDGANDLAVGDPQAVENGQANAGFVAVYASPVTATAKPSALLFDPGVDSGEKFGRSLVDAPFTSGGTTRTLLTVAAKDKVFVYFKITPASVDPRK